MLCACGSDLVRCHGKGAQSRFPRASELHGEGGASTVGHHNSQGCQPRHGDPTTGAFRGVFRGGAWRRRPGPRTALCCSAQDRLPKRFQLGVRGAGREACTPVLVSSLAPWLSAAARSLAPSLAGGHLQVRGRGPRGNAAGAVAVAVARREGRQQVLVRPLYRRHAPRIPNLGALGSVARARPVEGGKEVQGRYEGAIGRTAPPLCRSRRLRSDGAPWGMVV